VWGEDDGGGSRVVTEANTGSSSRQAGPSPAPRRANCCYLAISRTPRAAPRVHYDEKHDHEKTGPARR